MVDEPWRLSSRNGAFHGGIFAWLSLLLISRYHLHDTGIGLALAGYGLPGIFFGTVIGKWGDRYGRSYVVPAGFFWAAGCAFLLLLPSPRFVAALVITALSAGFDATHPLMSSITTSLDPKHRGQITGLATFTNFVGMGIGAFCFQRLIAFELYHCARHLRLGTDPVRLCGPLWLSRRAPWLHGIDQDRPSPISFLVTLGRSGATTCGCGSLSTGNGGRFPLLTPYKTRQTTRCTGRHSPKVMIRPRRVRAGRAVRSVGLLLQRIGPTKSLSADG